MRRISKSGKIGVAFIGTGAVTAYHHLPGLRLDPRAELVAVCDADPEILKKRQAEWGVEHASTDPEVVCGLDAVDAVVIATPNDTHRPIAVAAAKAGKHVMCEKPLGLNAPEVGEMYAAARRGRGAHDGLHVSVCAVDAIPTALAQVRGAGNAASFSIAAVSRLAGNELGVAAIPGAGGRGRPVRHDHSPD